MVETKIEEEGAAAALEAEWQRSLHDALAEDEEGESEAGAGAGGAEAWAARLAARAARDEARAVRGVLAAAGGGRALGAALEAAGARAAELRERHAACAATVRGAAGVGGAAAAAAHASARRLLDCLKDLLAPLDFEAAPEQWELGAAAGRARALAHGAALRALLAAAGAEPARRLAAVRERARRGERARAALAAAVARHVNTALLAGAGDAAARAPLLEYAPFMQWLKDMDEKAYDSLLKVYGAAWGGAGARRLAAAGEAARARAQAPDDAALPEEPLDTMLALAEAAYSAEQDFCRAFFCIDDAKSEAARAALAAATAALEPELLLVVQHYERAHPFGAFVALAVTGRRVRAAGAAAGAGAAVGVDPGTPGGEGARACAPAIAAAAVAAKRAADNIVFGGAHECGRETARRARCGVLPCISRAGRVAARAEAAFGREAAPELDRWCSRLAAACLACAAAADHPRTPRPLLRLENYHALLDLLAQRRSPALEHARREARRLYKEALSAYVATYFGRPLERLHEFFEAVSAELAAGARPDEVGFRAACSKQRLRRVLLDHPPDQVRKSLHRLYRTVEKHAGDSPLLQVLWRALQEEFLRQHAQLEELMALCYPGAGLALPLTTQEILEAFSDIAREH